MSQTYTPRIDSVAARCITFFKANPDEELTLEDIQDKFDAVRSNIHTLLAPARDAGYLSRHKNDDGEYIYKAGAKIGKAEVLPAGPFGAPPPAPPHSRPCRRSARPAADRDPRRHPHPHRARRPQARLAAPAQAPGQARPERLPAHPGATHPEPGRHPGPQSPAGHLHQPHRQRSPDHHRLAQGVTSN